MKINVNASIGDHHLVLIPVYKHQILKKDELGLNEELEALFDQGVFIGKQGTHHFLRKNKKVLFFGMGEETAITPALTREAIGGAVREAKRLKAKSLAFYCREPLYLGALVETAILADYDFDRYKTGEKEQAVEDFNVIMKEDYDEAVVAEYKALAEGTLVARDLANEPSNVLSPLELALRAGALGEQYGFEVEIHGREVIEGEKMGAFLAVASASESEPQLIVMRYKGAPAVKKTFGLVGKGLTYDSGGLSIKSTEGMVTMKGDMSGSAAVIGTFAALARNQVKANVVGVVAACENMISGKGFRPGDILQARNGKTIFVGNTDAEGRLTLADALDYIIDAEKVDEVVDIATLTGAAVRALGTTTTAIMGNREDMIKRFFEASTLADERLWELPLFEDYKEQLKHHEADLNNLGGDPGTITAAAFLEHFVGETPWVHLDIAGTAFADKARGYRPRGATGMGVRLLYHYIKGDESN
jgi:leucyl aminopeptidase